MNSLIQRVERLLPPENEDTPVTSISGFIASQLLPKHESCKFQKFMVEKRRGRVETYFSSLLLQTQLRNNEGKTKSSGNRAALNYVAPFFHYPELLDSTLQPDYI